MYVDRTDLAVFALLVLAAFVAYVFYIDPLASAPTALTPTPSFATAAPTAVVSELLLPCLDSAQPDACAGTAAYDASSLSACQDWPLPDACRYFYFSQRAEREKDTLTPQQGMQDCLSINNTAIRASCLQEYAMKTGNPGYCQALEYGMFRQACLDEVSRS
ncbi:hypothetical protein HYV43_02150 [Candidatus Micrarchaeota archaeon]|nr:hypothetical protein [Candidatus Micrarchaeota archaeon]